VVIEKTNIIKVRTYVGPTTDCPALPFDLQRTFPGGDVVRIREGEKETFKTQVAVMGSN
jgi:hypothetical protein